MTLQPQHLGLYFDADLIQLAQSRRKENAISDALHYLTHTTPDDLLADAQICGLRYPFLNDDKSGNHAIDTLQNINLHNPSHHYLETLQYTLAMLSVVESVRQHPAWGHAQDTWLDTIRQHVDTCLTPTDHATLLEDFWLGALAIGAAVVFEDETWLNRGRAIYQIAMDEHIHPEGYLKGIVDADDVTDTYQQQVLGVGALVLMAEMATRAGVDLWSINNRGITPITATTYLMYYYYYPDKWKWESGLTADKTQTIIKTHGAYIEMVNRHSPIRGIEIMLDDQRPLFSLTCGGLTTLTHGTIAPSKKRRWRLFG